MGSCGGRCVRMENYKCKHPILTTMFKNVSRTSKAEILKIFKNIQPQPKN